jgi:hypothetical protein
MHICLTCNNGINNTEMQLVPNIQTHGLENTGNQSIPRCTWSDNKVRELDTRGIVHYEFVSTGQTVNQVYYLEVLKRLGEKVRRKRPKLFTNKSWILQHNNAPAHTALSLREFLATKQITVLEHLAY